MKKLIAAVVMCVGCAACFGQDVDAAKRAKVETMLAAMHVDKMMDQMMAMAKAQIAQTQQGLPQLNDMTPQQKKIFDNYQTSVLQLVTDSVSWKAMEPEVVKLYANAFTEKEIDDIAAFYQSPTGQAMLQKTPQLMAGMMQFTQGRIADLQPKMKALTDQFMQDMKAAGKTSAPSKS